MATLNAGRRQARARAPQSKSLLTSLLCIQTAIVAEFALLVLLTQVVATVVVHKRRLALSPFLTAQAPALIGALCLVLAPLVRLRT